MLLFSASSSSVLWLQWCFTQVVKKTKAGFSSAVLDLFQMSATKRKHVSSGRDSSAVREIDGDSHGMWYIDKGFPSLLSTHHSVCPGVLFHKLHQSAAFYCQKAKQGPSFLVAGVNLEY